MDTGSLKSPRANVVYDDGVLRITRTDRPPALAIAGEIDESTYAGLLGALQELAHGPGDVQVSLGGVTYCDLAGLRAIIRLAGTNGDQARCGRRLVLRDVPEHLRTVLQIIGWDTTSGLAIEELVAGPASPPAERPAAAFPADQGGSRATAGLVLAAYDRIER